MANLLYGSSNVYRHFASSVEAGAFSGRNLQLVRCTQKAVFDSHLLGVVSPNLIVTSVLANFVSDACVGIPDDEVALFANQQITAHIDSLSDVISRFESLNVIVVPPLYRSEPKWFGSYLPGLLTFLSSEVNRVQSPRLAVCTPFVVAPSLLEADGIHLNPAGGRSFMTHIDAQLNSMLLAVDVPVAAGLVSQDTDSRLDRIFAVVSKTSTQVDSLQTLGSTVSELAQSTSTFEAFVRRRFKDDDFIFARMKEESDADLNKAREDRVVITGLPGPIAATSTHAEKKRHYLDVLTRLVAIACSASETLPSILDVYVNVRRGNFVFVYRLRLLFFI